MVAVFEERCTEKMNIILCKLFLSALLLIMGVAKGSICNQNLGKIVNISKNNTLKFEIITSVSQMTVNLPNYVKEFKIQFYDESENFRSLKDPLGMERVFFVADLKKSKTFKFGFPIIAKVNLRHLKNRGIMKRKYHTLFD